MVKLSILSVFRPARRVFLRILTIGCLSFCCSVLPAVAYADPKPDPAIEKLLDAPSMRGGITAYVVEGLDDKSVVFKDNADVRLMPASNRKLFTTAAVLGLLGPNATISTAVVCKSTADPSGAINGDIYLRGGGDSLLSTADLDTLARSMAANGVKRIAGGVVGDGGAFEDGPYGTNWGWDTLNDDYAPAITGLEVNDGCLKIDVTPGAAPSAPAVYTVDPPTRAQAIVDNAVTGAEGTPDTIHARHPWEKDAIVLSGSVPAGGHKSIDIPVADPVLYAADLFRAALLHAGISVAGDASVGSTPPDAKTILATHVSPPMSDYIASMNKPSDNLLAESLMRVIGIVKEGHGTYDAGDDAETAYFKSIELDVDTLTLDDGSGVSRRNYVTAQSVVDLLIFASKQPYFDAFRKSLPIAGVDGTLRHRLVGTAAAGNVRHQFRSWRGKGTALARSVKLGDEQGRPRSQPVEKPTTNGQGTRGTNDVVEAADISRPGSAILQGWTDSGPRLKPLTMSLLGFLVGIVGGIGAFLFVE